MEKLPYFFLNSILSNVKHCIHVWLAQSLPGRRSGKLWWTCAAEKRRQDITNHRRLSSAQQSNSHHYSLSFPLLYINSYTWIYYYLALIMLTFCMGWNDKTRIQLFIHVILKNNFWRCKCVCSMHIILRRTHYIFCLDTQKPFIFTMT